MTVDSTDIIILLWSSLLTATSIGIGWVINRIFKQQDSLHKADEQIRKDLSTNYARRDDVKDFKDEVLEYLRRIEDKMDKKADK